MSRTSLKASELLLRFPRVSGDEPRLGDGVFLVAEFSPRERG